MAKTPEDVLRARWAVKMNEQLAKETEAEKARAIKHAEEEEQREQVIDLLFAEIQPALKRLKKAGWPGGELINFDGEEKACWYVFTIQGNAPVYLVSDGGIHDKGDWGYREDFFEPYTLKDLEAITERLKKLPSYA